MAKFGAARRYFERIVVPHTGDDCLIWPFARDRIGYARMWDKGRCAHVHRLVCEAVHGPASDPKLNAAHKCGRGLQGCVNPRHVRWVTAKENTADKLLHGTFPRGERHPQARLTWRDVDAIRASAGRVKQRELAAIYKTSEAYIRHIQHHRVWRDEGTRI